MIKSIRWRLQIWYSLVLVAVVSAFAGILYVRARATTFREIDSRLEASVRYLDADLRSFPPHLLEGGRPPPEGLPFRKKEKKDLSDSDQGANGYLDPPPPRKKNGKEGPHFPVRKSDEELVERLGVPPSVQAEPVVAAPTEFYFAVWRHDGGILKAVDLPEGTAVPEESLEGNPSSLDFRYHETRREVVMRGPQRTRILVGVSTVQRMEELRTFAWQLGLAGVIVLAVGLAGGSWISARIFRPIAAMSATASEISAAKLSGRINVELVDTELAGLARVLNAAFDRLQEAFERQAQFTADASHELRTPLAVIRSHAQLALDRTRTAEEYRQTIESCLRAADRMTSIVEGLLALARADAGWPGLQMQPVELGSLLTEAVASFRPLAEAKRIAISTDIAEVQVRADAGALSQVVNNLLANAVKYNRTGGSIRVRLLAMASAAIFTIADTGNGIPDEDQPHIFERFYRVDKARSRASGGTGLGLAICKNIVEAHGGTIGFETKVDSGTTFWVRLPVASSSV